MQNAGEQSLANLDRLYHHSKGDTHTADWRLNMQRVMHNNAGVYRNGQFLKEGCAQIRQLAADMEKNLMVCVVFLCVS